MNLDFIYDIFLTSTKNRCSDLVGQALPMLLSDARTGTRVYTDEQTDLDLLHTSYPALAEQEGRLRAFIGQHYEELVEAYRSKDRAVFDAAAAACLAADQAKEEQNAETEGGAVKT